MRLWILFFAIVSTAAHADSLAVAREHYARANTAYDLQQFLEAAREYEEAFRLKPDPVLLFNIGQSYRNAKEYEKAIGAYRSFLRRLPNSPHRAEVESRMSDLRALLDAQKREREQPPAGPAAVEMKPPEPAPLPALKPTPEPPPVPVAPPPRFQTDRKAQLAGAVVAVVGLGLAGGGIAFELMRRGDGDALAHPAAGTPYSHTLADRYHEDVTAEAALFAAGGAAVIAGTVTALLGLRKTRVVPSLGRSHAALSFAWEL